MLDEHPIIRNIALAIGFVSVVGGGGGIMWNIYAESERSADQTQRLMEIRHEQEGIRRELALQTEDLDTIRKVQSELKATLNRRFDRVEDNQRWLADQIQEGTVATAIELGRFMERTRE